MIIIALKNTHCFSTMVTYGPSIKFCITLKVCLPLFFPTSDIILSLPPSGVERYSWEFVVGACRFSKS